MRASPPATGGCWLIYALGGGLGHLSRSLALARAACRRGHQVRIVSNSPHAKDLPLQGPAWEGIRLFPLDPALPPAEVGQVLERELGNPGVNLLLVDTFPRGLGGELASLLPSWKGPKFLVHRDLNPRYVHRYQLASFVQHYDGLLVPGEAPPLRHFPHAVSTAPWLLFDADELPSPAQARAALGEPASHPGPRVGVVLSGREEEIEAMGRFAERLVSEVPARVLMLHPPSSQPQAKGRTVWPLLPLLPGLDVLVAAGGYNTVQEARATGTPLVAFARPRLYDRQHRRLTPEERVEDEAEALRRIRQVLSRAAGPQRVTPRYENGVHAAVHHIEGHRGALRLETTLPGIPAAGAPKNVRLALEENGALPTVPPGWRTVAVGDPDAATLAWETFLSEPARLPAPNPWGPERGPASRARDDQREGSWATPAP